MISVHSVSFHYFVLTDWVTIGPLELFSMPVEKNTYSLGKSPQNWGREFEFSEHVRQKYVFLRPP